MVDVLYRGSCVSDNSPILLGYRFDLETKGTILRSFASVKVEGCGLEGCQVW